MKQWEMLLKETPITDLRALKMKAEGDYVLSVYASSIQSSGSTLFFIAREAEKKMLVLCGSREFFDQFCGEQRIVGKHEAKVCPLNHDNCVALRQVFSYVNPEAIGNRQFSFGLGDRLGLATPGQIRAVKEQNTFPILAQQSMRELNLTKRTYVSVLDDVCWGVFQEGYTGGFGADADHLKTDDEVKYGLESGYTMVTLDCSEHIENACFDMDETALKHRYERLSDQERAEIEREYLNVCIDIDGMTISFDRQTLMRLQLVYGRAIAFMAHIFHDYIESCGRQVDFEVSIDETTVTTSPGAHYFIASQLKNRTVRVSSLAPRFCGEFQKGIDYIGSLGAFEAEFCMHEKIARHFGYRLSIHSGSDKFSVFPIIGGITGMNVHVKTAGTNWLEAVRLIAAKNPELYRRMHSFSLSRLNEARKYYHVGTEPENIPKLDTLKDADLPALMEQNDARQLLHITYGLLLNEKDATGRFAFRDDIERTLYTFENEYYDNLTRHIGKHLSKLRENLAL